MQVCQYVQRVGSQVVGSRKGDAPARGFVASLTPAAFEVVGRGHGRGQRSDKTGDDTNEMSGIEGKGESPLR
jgi:hypothetical protein